MDVASMFETSLPVLETVMRGTLIFLGLTFALRVTGQRESGGLAVTDLLVIVLIVQAVAHAMAPGSASLTDGFVLVVTMLVWSVALDAFAYRFPSLRHLVKPARHPLIEHGELNHRVMRREFLSREEVEEQLRLHGVEDVKDVRRAYLEPSGTISVFREDGLPTA